MKKDIKKLVKELDRQGFDVHVTRRGHLAIRQAGMTVAVLAGTPSDWRSARNGLARLRRAGFQFGCAS
ncbi:hypothetical protein SIM91_02830 [Rhodococcus opacus]|uniref:hypothetical protein n=1 Tax=Rhodococcus opacus TaxID=37919 RepID=UPI0007CD8D40|nr:hypothetical protein [Rhodococcus opacus]MDX5962277.1 hypothetical protein [Rhodococcus opacus]NKY74829.1 type II toxin-antitoxin system HicA family toxin [Rhodococcus opacus]CAG7641781.1 hypothetical protein E143388_08319 [Rhodococcus opacus]